MNSPASTASRQVLGAIVFVTAIRVILSAQLELTSVESYLWVCAQRPALGYYDYPGMIAWMGRLSTAIFGHSVLGFRALTLVSSAGMIWLIFLAARRLYDEQVARLSALLAAFVPLLFVFSAEATPDAPCLFFWSATAWALAHAFSGDSPRWWYPAGLFLGLAMDSKYHAVFLGLGVFGFLLFSPDHRFWLRRKEPWLGVSFALLAFSPTLLWNAQNGWQSFAYQGVSRFKESGFQPSQLWRFPASQLGLLTPFIAVGAWAVGIPALGRWRESDWRERYLTALGTPVLLFFFLVIISRPVRGHWAAPGYLTTLILTAAAVLRRGLWVRRLVGGSLGVLAAGYLLLPALLATMPVDQRSGWAFLGEEVARRKPDFVLCNEYHLASQMGFVLRTKESWELTPAGKPSKNFPNWWNQAEHLGKNAVIVYDGRHFPGEMDRIRRCFDRVDEPELVIVPRLHAGPLGEDERFWVLNAWNYRGAPSIEPRLPTED